MDFLTLPEYDLIARKIIGKLIKSDSLKRILFSDEDAFGMIVSALINADWKYQPDKGASLSTFRVTGVLNAIKQWNKKRYRRITKEKQCAVSMSDISMIEVLCVDKCRKPEDYLEQDINVNHTLKSCGLSDRQVEVIKKRILEGYSIKELADEMGVSKQAVSQSYNLGVDKIRQYYNKG